MLLDLECRRREFLPSSVVRTPCCVILTRTANKGPPTPICFAQDDAVSFVVDRFSCKYHLRSPFLSQILPAWVECFNQSNLLLPPPTFQLLLAIDGFPNIIKALEVNEAIATVLASEPLKLTALVVQNSPVKIVGHSNVKSTRATADDVDAIFLVVRHSLLTVILSAAVARKANDHAVEGPRDFNLATPPQGISTLQLRENAFPHSS